MIGKRKKLSIADKWVGQRFLLREAEIHEALRKESIGKSGYPMNRVWVRIELVSMALCDVKLAKAFLRVYVNDAPLRIIEWGEKEESYYPSARDYRREISVYGGKNYTLPALEDGFLDIFVNIPPYIDTDKTVHLRILGYLTLSSFFGHFDKQVKYDLKIEPEDWK